WFPRRRRESLDRAAGACVHDELAGMRLAVVAPVPHRQVTERLEPDRAPGPPRRLHARRQCRIDRAGRELEARGTDRLRTCHPVATTVAAGREPDDIGRRVLTTGN